MPKLSKPLTDVQLRSAKGGLKPKGFAGRIHDEPTDKEYPLPDGGGLYLLVKPDGTKLWRMQCRFAGAGRLLAFGKYPDVSLNMARELRRDAKAKIASGVDPAQAKRIEKIQRSASAANTFEAVARAWHANKLDSWQPGTAANVMRRLEKDIFPIIGRLPIADIRAPVMLDVLRQIEKRGALDMAKRQGQVCGQIFRFAIAEGKAEIDPVPALRGALKPSARGHHAAITVDELPEFVRILEKNEVHMLATTRIMFRIMMLVFVRTSELTETPWSEIDLDNEKWVIPWPRMKMGKRKVNPRKVDHHVFLPTQGWELLRELHRHTGGAQFLFPNRNDHSRPASNWGILAALKRMGYTGKMTGHGFRSLAMGVIKERLGYRHEVVDRQLSHASGDAYGEAYDRAMFLDERRKMMQEYADYLDAVADGKVVTPNFRRAA